MVPELIYHDLLTVPSGSRKTGLYWLRLFRQGGRYVAVITEVPGNPGFSVTTIISGITIHILQEFGIGSDQLTAYGIYPRVSDLDSTSVCQVKAGPPVSWKRSSLAEIEADLGIQLPELPHHEELYRQVLQRGGGSRTNIYHDIFEAFPVADLPSFRNPFKCVHSERFKTMKADAEKESPRYDQERVGRAFADTLTTVDAGACHYHQADWKAIADESVRIITAFGQRQATVYATAAGQSPLPPEDRRWLWSLFDTPIHIDDGSYADGQHRACALRFSGATAAAVVVRTEIEKADAVWHYQGDG